MTATEYVFLMTKWFGGAAAYFTQIQNDPQCVLTIAALLALADDPRQPELPESHYKESE